MEARSAWVLNLDAEYELEDPRGYSPSPAVQRRVREQAERVRGLLGAHDVLLGDGDAVLAGEFTGRAWCPTPRALECLRRAGATLPAAPPLEVLQRVNDRRFGVELSSGVLGSRYVGGRDALPRAVELLSAVSPSGRWVAKRSFGLAGRGHRRFGAPPDGHDTAWLRRSFQRGHGIVIEPWVEREADFVLHARVDGAGGVTPGQPLCQQCDERGMWQRTLPADDDAGAVLGVAERRALLEAAEETGYALHGAGYSGPFGIDAFRYRTPDGVVAFNPRVEINARYGMGWSLSGLEP